MTNHKHNANCDVLELTNGTMICLTEEPGLRAQIYELMPRAGDHVSVTYVADNADGTKRFAVKVTRA